MKDKGQQVYFILKIEGRSGQPDHLQIRDGSFDLIRHFHDPDAQSLQPVFPGKRIAKKAMDLIRDLPFGSIEKLTL